MSDIRSGRAFTLLAALLLASAAASGESRKVPEIETSPPLVVLLHGLARSADSMARMADALEDHGYRTCNIDYPSRKHTVEVLAEEHVLPQIRACLDGNRAPVHFVTHSLGGILVRKLAHDGSLPPTGRVVMLSPPNHGSEVVDKLRALPPFHWWNGPAGEQLGTDPDSVPNRLGPAPFELGVITGDRTINFFLSTLIPGDDDGKVSLESAKLEGMADFLVVHASHPFIMRDAVAIRQTLHFLEHGRFSRPGP